MDFKKGCYQNSQECFSRTTYNNGENGLYTCVCLSLVLSPCWHAFPFSPNFLWSL